jgi:hypothetical protein
MTGVGGDAFWLIHDAKANTVRYIDGGGRATSGGTIDAFGKRGLTEVPYRGVLPGTLTVPGAVAGWAALLAAIFLPLGIVALLTLSAEPRAREAARAGFVGSASCGSCHAREYGDWRSSDHARAIATATPANVLGDFSGVTVHDGRHNASFRREGDRYIIRTDGPGGTVTDFTIAETFGVDPLQQYLVLFPDGRRQALPWAWDSRPREQGGQRWFHLMADDPLPAGDPLHWTGREQTWNFMCASCHSTGLVRGYDQATDRYDTSWTEISVGCESCHGGRRCAQGTKQQADRRAGGRG